MTAIQPAEPVVASRRVRTAIRVTGALFAAATLVGGLFTILTNIAFDQRTESAAFSGSELGAVDQLTIDNSAGRTVVRARDGDGAVITTDRGDGLLRARSGNEVIGNRLRVWGSCRASWITRCHVHQEIEAPADLDVRLSGQHGRIDVIGMSGALDIRGRFGTLAIDSASGPVRIEHQFGSLIARNLTAPSVAVDHHFGATTMSFAEPPTDVRVASHFGEVVIEVPDDGTTYRVSGASEFGERAIEVRSDPSSGRTIHVDTTFGRATIRYAR